MLAVYSLKKKKNVCRRKKMDTARTFGWMFSFGYKKKIKGEGGERKEPPFQGAHVWKILAQMT